jgi:hypothetical protein
MKNEDLRINWMTSIEELLFALCMIVSCLINYRAIQEVLKETSSKCKERGFLLLKLVKKYLEINEEHWIKRIKLLKT